MDINIKHEIIEISTAIVKNEPRGPSPSAEINDTEDIFNQIDVKIPIGNGISDNDQMDDAANLAETGEEDVPTDFFDDFNNKDFLAGLDVVDAWSEEVEEQEEMDTSYLQEVSNEILFSNQSKVSDEQLKLSNETANLAEEASKDPVGTSEVSDETNETSKVPVDSLPIQDQRVDSNNDEQQDQTKPVQLKSDRVLTSNDSINKPRETKEGTDKPSNIKKNMTSKRRSRSLPRQPDQRSIHKHADERRRDPDKVRRDIQRDKDKCEKDRITEKLRIVETGLVPPGTEMDVPDSPTKSVKPAPVSSSPQRPRPPPRDDKYISRVSKRPLSRSPSPYRRKRRLSPSPITNPRRRYSPPTTRRRSRSPIHKIIDRFEERRNRNRSRSNSPNRRYPRHASKHNRDKEYSPEVRKQSFLEELVEKLNSKDTVSLKNIAAKLNGDDTKMNQMSSMDGLVHHHSAHHGTLMLPNPSMGNLAPAPQIVPPPVQPTYSDVVYDQQFFVGNVDVPTYNPNSNIYAHGQVSYDPYQQTVPFYGQPHISQYAESSFESDAKLFNDENISMTEYLKLSTRNYDNTPQTNLSQKVKVLNRCQDSMKLMSELSRPNGHFFCNTNKLSEQIKNKPVDVKNLSSAKNAPAIRFSFTTKSHFLEDKQPTGLNRLLSRLGVKEKLRNHNYSVERTGDQSTQTVDHPCDECLTRKQRKTVDVGIQCEPETATFSGQVTDEDFLSTARSALKNFIKSNQSFSSLTPAQILAQLELDNETKPKAPDYDHRLQAEDRLERRAPMHEYERRPMHSELDYDRRPVDFDRRDWNARGNFLSSPSSHSSIGPRPLLSLHSHPNPLMSRAQSIGLQDSQYAGPQQQQSYRAPLLNSRPGLLQPPAYGSRNYMNDGRFFGNQY